MNYWTELSINYANQRNYLDSLFKVYPMSPNIRREIDSNKWSLIEDAYNNKENLTLIKELLKFDLFPIKDSYVAYLKKDHSAIDRNPDTVNRLAGTLHEMGLDEVYNKCTEPKETNRQIGYLFKRWVSSGVLGVPVINNIDEFLTINENAVLNISDNGMKKFAREYLGYNHEKGLDFIAKFNNKYIIGEAKFITDFGGHQNAQFNDAISTINSQLLLPNKLNKEVIKIAICDGILYIKNKTKIHRHLQNHDNEIVLSSLLLREFLFSI